MSGSMRIRLECYVNDISGVSIVVECAFTADTEVKRAGRDGWTDCLLDDRAYFRYLVSSLSDSTYTVEPRNPSPSHLQIHSLSSPLSYRMADRTFHPASSVPLCNSRHQIPPSP